ncbi:hypothetical protein [Methylocapsa palsarum]|nr:hypothetical protein [Methylocapsa palsarum]
MEIPGQFSAEIDKLGLLPCRLAAYPLKAPVLMGFKYHLARRLDRKF